MEVPKKRNRSVRREGIIKIEHGETYEDASYDV